MLIIYFLFPSSGVKKIRLLITEVGGSYNDLKLLKPKASYFKFINLKPKTTYRIEIQSEKGKLLSPKVVSEITTGFIVCVFLTQLYATITTLLLLLSYFLKMLHKPEFYEEALGSFSL